MRKHQKSRRKALSPRGSPPKNGKFREFKYRLQQLRNGAEITFRCASHGGPTPVKNGQRGTR